MKVLVTGASGLLGGRVARALAARGEDVTVLQRRPSGLGVREVLGDITEPSCVRAAVEGQEAVVHLAAKVNVVGDLADYERVNIRGTQSLIDASTSAGVSRFVQISSPSVGHAGTSLVGAPAGPADPRRARGNYARTKAAAELIALAADSPQMAVLALRPHLVWGPGDTQLVGRIVARARHHRLPVIGSGAPLVDTTYVDNATDAIVAGLDRCRSAHGQAYVVTNGEPRPVGEILDAWARAAGTNGPSLRVPTRLAHTAGALVEHTLDLRTRTGWASTAEADPPVTRFVVEQLTTAHWFDQRRTRDALAWEPRVSIDQGLEHLAAWYHDAARTPAARR